MTPKTNALISPKNWPARRPDGQTADAQSDPAPPVKGSSARPGTDKITVRVPTQKARRFKLYCAINHVEQKDLIEELLDNFFDSLAGRPDGQTALINLDDQMFDDEERSITSSSSQFLMGRPDGQNELKTRRRNVLAYYAYITGNPIKENDRDALETLIHLPTHILKAGIAKSFALCKGRINSFRYCLGAIEEIAESDVAENYLDYLESVLRRTGKLSPLPPPAEPPTQPALPGTSGQLTQLNDERKKP